jgi:hypothetical protein
MATENEIVGEGRAGQATIRSQKGTPVLEETYHYLVKAKSKDESRLSVLLTEGLPVTGITTTESGFAVCNSKTAVRRENQLLYWDVTATFSSQVDENQNDDPESDPTAWVPIYETKFERLQEILTKDQAGTSIANSAGQPFENGITRNRFIPIWEFWQFEPATVTDETIIERNESVNSGVFKGRAAHTLLLTVMSSVIGYYYGQPRRFTRYALRYNSANWKQKRLDVGTVYLDTGVHKPYLDGEGNVVLGGLNGSGAKVAVGTEPSVLEFEVYPEISFSFLRA